jgi:hypothetical protein
MRRINKYLWKKKMHRVKLCKIFTKDNEWFFVNSMVLSEIILLDLL